MIFPAPVSRDAYGYWTHPALASSGCKTAAAFSGWLRTHRISCFMMSMRDEAPEIFAAQLNDEVPDARLWVPEPPDDDEWFLGSVHATDYGPVCYWFLTSPCV